MEDQLYELLSTSIPGIFIVGTFIVVDKVLIPLWQGRAATINKRIEDLEQKQRTTESEVARANESIARANGVLSEIQRRLNGGK